MGAVLRGCVLVMFSCAGDWRVPFIVHREGNLPRIHQGPRRFARSRCRYFGGRLGYVADDCLATTVYRDMLLDHRFLLASTPYTGEGFHLSGVGSSQFVQRTLGIILTYYIWSLFEPSCHRRC